VFHSIRSLLFTPGHKPDWILKAQASGADAVIIDLEDAVPAEAKAEARSIAQDAVKDESATVPLFVRVNALDTPWSEQDLKHVVQRGLAGVVVPKVFSRDDIIRWDALLDFAEVANGVPRGQTPVVVSLETASSIRDIDHILDNPRVRGIMAAAAKDADISRSLGFSWTAQGMETLYLRSRAVVAARSADLPLISLGLWQDITNLDGLATWASDNSALGFTAGVMIHPSHAAIVNAAFGLNDAERSRLERLVQAFDEAEAAGNAAVVFEGEHIDTAHATAAREKLKRAG
jgi:citrate lyase subunit beta/citryl-CoA lyase